MKSNSIKTIFFAIFFMGYPAILASSYALKRLQQPSKQAIEAQSGQMFNREVKRYAITGVSAVTLLCCVHGFFMMSTYLQQSDDQAKRIAKLEQKTIDLSDKAAIILPAKETWFGWAKKQLIDSVPMLFINAAFAEVWPKLKGCLGKVYAAETVHWYVNEHTKIWQVLHDIKGCSAKYDLYSELLSADKLIQQNDVYIKAFLHELTKVSQDKNRMSMMSNSDFYDDLLDAIRTKYMKKGIKFEALQDTASDIVAKVQRAKHDGFENANLVSTFEQDIKQIEIMSNQLASDLQHLVDFIVAKYKDKDMVAVLIDNANKYFEHMENLLNSSLSALEQMSKANKGLFTCSYEYELLLKEQVEFLQRYMVIG